MDREETEQWCDFPRSKSSARKFAQLQLTGTECFWQTGGGQVVFASGVRNEEEECEEDPQVLGHRFHTVQSRMVKSGGVGCHIGIVHLASLRQQHICSPDS